MTHESARWHAHWRVTKYRDGAPTPYEVLDLDGNLLTTAGATALWTALSGGAITAFSNANAKLGVGDSTTAAAASQTDLQAATNKLRKAVDATYPTISGATMTFQATFATTDANWAWQEVAAFNAATGGTMLNRKVQSLGTKTSADTWVLTLTITLS